MQPYKILIGLIFLILTAPAMSQEPNIPDGFVLSPLMRSTHFVRDIEESLKLYRDILGLRTRLEVTLEGEQVGALLGTRDSAVKAVLLQSGDLVFANVGLFQIVEDNPTARSAPRNHVQTGDAALVFLTSDIFGIYEKVKNAGYSTISPPLVLFPDSEASTQSYEVLFFDHDGIGVNLIQRRVPISD